MALVTRTRLFVELLGSLQWQAPLHTEVDLSAADGGAFERQLADGTSALQITFPGITTLSTLWVTSDKAISVTMGPTGSNQPKTLQAGGLLGFAGGALTASTALSVTYTPGDSSTATLLYFAAGS